MKKLLVTLLLSGALFSGFAHEDPDRKLPIVTGDVWLSSSDAEKKAFLLGFATMIELEKEIRGAQATSTDTFIPVLVKGLSQYSIAEISAQIDNYYQTNEDKRSSPVVEYIWLGIAAPAVAAHK